jgi:hypothetical protein
MNTNALGKAGKISSAATGIGTINDIASITVDISNYAGFIVQGVPLVNNGGEWSANIDDLPAGEQLTFAANAYNSSSLKIFNGATAQMLTGASDMIYIVMSPSANGMMQQFPMILQISRPSEIGMGSTAPVSISVQGSTGETLSYELLAAADGGTFTPSSGSMTLSGTQGMIVVNYTAPDAIGTSVHAVKVTNSLGNSVQSVFDTNVTTQAGDPTVIVQFNPVILGVSAGRNGSDVIFSATVSDNGPANDLTYSWSFSNGLSFADSTTNPAILQGYDESVSGMIMLRVANALGGHTSVSYMIKPGQFATTLVNNTPLIPQTLHQIAGACQVAAVSGNIVALAIEEGKEQVDYNNDGDMDDRILGYFDVSTQQVVRTDIALANDSVAIDGDIMVYRIAATNTIGWYSISAGTGNDTGIVPDDFGRGTSAPTRVLSSSRIAYVAGGKLNIYDISTAQNTATLIAVPDTTSVSFSGNIVAFVGQIGTIMYYDVATGAVHDTGETGSYPTIDKKYIVYETPETRIAYYDIDNGMNVLTPILYTGYHASISNGIITASVPEDVYWGDMNGDGTIDGSGYLVLYDIPTGRMAGTGIKMCCGVDIAGSIITVCQDNGCFQWYAMLEDLVKGYFKR